MATVLEQYNCDAQKWEMKEVYSVPGAAEHWMRQFGKANPTELYRVRPAKPNELPTMAQRVKPQ